MTAMLLRYRIARLRRQAEAVKRSDFPLYEILRRKMLNEQALLWELTRGRQ